MIENTVLLPLTFDEKPEKKGMLQLGSEPITKPSFPD
jgi:hypothetical protein